MTLLPTEAEVVLVAIWVLAVEVAVLGLLPVVAAREVLVAPQQAVLHQVLEVILTVLLHLVVLEMETAHQK